MDISTRFMGLDIRSPLVVGASPLSDDVGGCRALEDAGAGALVMRSLFMEQLRHDEEQQLHVESHLDAFAEAQTLLPGEVTWSGGPDEYLERLRALKEALDIPVIGSLNGTHVGDWTRYAQAIQQAGADGLELNVYYQPLHDGERPGQVEQRYFNVLAEVRGWVDIPVSMKLLPFMSSPIYTVRRLAEAGASGFVLFNRLFPGEIDIERLEVVPQLSLSDPSLLRARLMWVAAISPHVDVPLCASGGVHTTQDVIRAVMAGADCVQLVSALLRGGPDVLRRIDGELRTWLEEHEYTSLGQMRGSMSLGHAPDPDAFERANYMKVLNTWRPPAGGA